MSIRLVQLRRGDDRRVGLVDEPQIRVLEGVESVYGLASEALRSGVRLSSLAADRAAGEALSYDDVYAGGSEWELLPAADHPGEPTHCLVSGTGLTHMASAARRDAMHASSPETATELTDSMRMFRWGVEGGKPANGCVGTSPEWFYKGNGLILRACNQPLTVPWHAEDGGEEPEVAGVYLVAADGDPVRIGLAAGNEFSDHKFEKRNYLYLAASKLRECAIGPELVVDADFGDVPGNVKIERGGEAIWQREIHTGEANMCHSVANMEHHHFKFGQHRIPGDLHVHFFGADAFSFGDALELTTADVMHVEFAGFGRALRNPVMVEAKRVEPVRVRAL